MERDWQQNSDVIRGNLLIIPVEDALFYIEAIYLQTKPPQGKKGEEETNDDTARRPKLQMIVVKSGANELGMVDKAKTFDQALNVLFLGEPVNGETAANGEKPLTVEELFKQLEQIEAASAVQKKQIREQITQLLEAQGNR